MYHIVFQEASLLPRERLLTEGPDKLSNQELLSILLRTGNKNKTVYEIAQELLGSLKSLKELASMSFQELQEVPGIKHMATSIILVHNHPSGIIHPSKNDDGVTQQMIEACNCLGIVFLDHLIVSTDDYYSYREETDLLV